MKKVQKYFTTLMVVLLVLGMTGCGASHGTATGIVKSLIQAYAEGKDKVIKDCYGKKEEADENLQKEIDATIKYLQAHGTQKIKIVDTGVLSETDTYVYVYITYNLVLENEQEYPCVSTYMVNKVDRKYYIVPTAEVTEAMSEQAITDYQEFMTMDAYKEYRRAYDTFIKQNVGYEEKLAGRLG